MSEDPQMTEKMAAVLALLRKRPIFVSRKGRSWAILNGSENVKIHGGTLNRLVAAGLVSFEEKEGGLMGIYRAVVPASDPTPGEE